MENPNKDLLLSPYRVLDLTDDKGFLCGRILADLGADVIKVETPGGDPARNTGPFYKDIPDPEFSDCLPKNHSGQKAALEFPPRILAGNYLKYDARSWYSTALCASG